jgi:hypothetical protein
MNSLEGADRSAIYNGDHHSLVKSARIVADRQRPEVLSPALKRKIERYIVFWRKQNDGTWPVNAAVSDGTKSASWSERTRDRLRHRLLRTFDLTVPVLYSMVPIAVWQRYRQMKSRYQQVEARPHTSESV